MGFFSNLADALSQPTLKEPVRGTARVVSVSMPPNQTGGGGMCAMNLVINLPGRPSVAVNKANLVALAQWPMPGMDLPVEAEASDPTRFKILWNEVPTSADRATAQARQVAEFINAANARDGVGATAAAGGAAQPFGAQTNVTVNGHPATPDDLAHLEALTGMKLTGGATAITRERLHEFISEAIANQPPLREEDGPDDDRLSALERLARLRDTGVLTQTEFEAEKRRILTS